MITALIPAVTGILDKFIPDADTKQKLSHEISTMAEKHHQQLMLAQIKVNEAEAKGIRQVLDSKAAGYESLVHSCNGNAKAASTLLMIEKIEEIVAKQVEAIKNLQNL